LRFLEREGLVAPVRTRGGHRLYHRTDLARIRQIKAWQAHHLSLEEIRHRLAGRDALLSSGVVVDRFLSVALNGELAEAARVIADADELGIPVAELFGDVLRPCLCEIGARWEAGSLPVGQEKEISELARELVAELSHRHADPQPRGPVAVAACVAGEQHELGLRMIVGLLRERGWRVHFLGADVDPRFLTEVIQLRRPAAVLLSATTRARLPDLAAAIEVVRGSGTSDETPVAVGGGQALTDSADWVRGLGAIPVIGNGLDTVLDVIGAPDV
jgi:methanogenic corrinoid protein MtbC1